MISKWGHQYCATLVLIAIIAASAAVSTYRVFALPILQCPDEDSHIDYAFSLYSAGSLLNVREAPASGWNIKHRAPFHRWERISHLYTLHLTDATRMYKVRLSEEEKVPEDYGTKAFYERIDRTAPRSPVRTEGLTPLDNPGMVSGYPFGYYALVAVEMWVARLFSDSLVSMFFSARLLSVVLLIVSLAFSYAVLRQVHSRNALGITAIVGLFPVTTYVSSCVQPDNLSLTLVVLSWYLGLSAYRDFDRKHVLILLSLVLGLLLVTKTHHYPFVAIPILALLIAKHRPPAWVIGAILLPSLGLFLVDLWVKSGAPIVGDHMVFSLDDFVKKIAQAIGEYYGGGYAYASYWSTSYGWPSVPYPVKIVLQAATILALLTVLLGLGRTAVRLVVVAKRKARSVLPLVLDPLVTGHLLFVLFMIFLFAITTNAFYAQGRHFFPFILSGFYVVIKFAPRVLGRRDLEERLSSPMIILLLILCVAAGWHALVALGPRYYPERRVDSGTALFTHTHLQIVDSSDRHDIRETLVVCCHGLASYRSNRGD
jgi:hypothetical protein